MDYHGNERGRFLILIADDDAALASLLREILTDEGYDTTCCFTGAAALHAIEHDAPHLAILDLQMEHESAGLSVVEQLRHSTKLRHLPVILCSASQPRLQTLGPTLEELACVAILKPFNIDHLLDTIEALLPPADAGELAAPSGHR
jgi:DNA-binding response OmpR family regulator